MDHEQMKALGRSLLVTLPLLVLHGYLLAIIYQQWWLRQFGIPSYFVHLDADTLLIAALSLAILLGILLMCYYALSPLLNKTNIFRKHNDSVNFVHAVSLGIALVGASIGVAIGFFHFGLSVEQFSWGFIGGIAGIMILTTAGIVQWGLRSRASKRKWYARPYLYYEKRLMTPIIFSVAVFLIGSYLVAGQLAIMNWQSYVKEPNYVLIDGTDQSILIGVFGDKVGVVKEGEFGIERDTVKFVDIDRITIIERLSVD